MKRNTRKASTQESAASQEADLLKSEAARAALIARIEVLASEVRAERTVSVDLSEELPLLFQILLAEGYTLEPRSDHQRQSNPFLFKLVKERKQP